MLRARVGGEVREGPQQGGGGGSQGAMGALGSTPPMETPREWGVSSRTESPARHCGGRGLAHGPRQPLLGSVPHLVCPSRPETSLAGPWLTCPSPSSWSWTPSTRTRPAGSVETLTACLSSTSSSPTVSPSPRLSHVSAPGPFPGAPWKAALSPTCVHVHAPLHLHAPAQSQHPQAHLPAHSAVRPEAHLGACARHRCSGKWMCNQAPPSPETRVPPPIGPRHCCSGLQTLPPRSGTHTSRGPQPPGPLRQAREAPLKAHP